MQRGTAFVIHDAARILIREGKEGVQTLVVVTFHCIQEGALIACADRWNGDTLHEKETHLHGSFLRLSVREGQHDDKCTDGDICAMRYQVVDRIRASYNARPVQGRSTKEVLLIHIVSTLNKE